MKFELFVALRYLFALKRSTFISIISVFSILGVAIGVASLIVVMGVMNGFSKDFRDKILGVNAHVIVASVSGSIRDYRDVEAKARKVEGVVAVTPFIYNEVMLSTESGVKGVILRGIDPATAGEVLSLPRDMVEGSVADLARTDLPTPPIIIGQELAKRLGLRPGSQVNLLSPSGRQSAAGFSPKIKIFTVAGIFKSGMFEYDSSMGYVSIPAAQELFGYREDLVSGLELRIKDEALYQADRIGEAVKNAVGGFPYYARNWMEMNENLFAALQLEKTGMFVILIMIILVGTFSIVTTLVMLVMEKTKDIAILMSMGARAGSIRRIFMFQGTIIGLIGTTLGYLMGVSVSLTLKKYQFIKLPSDVYPMDHLPIRLDWLDLTMIGVVAFLLCFLATVYPARQASRLKPAEALHYE